MILIRTGYRDARRTQFSVRCASGNPSESFPTTSGSGVTPKLALSTTPRYFVVVSDMRNTSTGVPGRVWEICVSLKFASTHQCSIVDEGEQLLAHLHVLPLGCGEVSNAGIEWRYHAALLIVVSSQPNRGRPSARAARARAPEPGPSAPIL